MRPRILHVIPRLDWGSAARQVIQIARECRRSTETHVAATLITLDHRHLLETAGTVCHDIPSSRWWSTGSMIDLIGVVRALQPHVVHAWRLPRTWPTVLGLRVANRSQLVIDTRMDEGRSEWLSTIGIRLAQRLSAVCVIPQATSCDIQTPATNRVLIPDRVSDAFQPDTIDAAIAREDVRRELGIGGHAKLILYAGRLLRRKRLRDLIWAADLLKVVRGDTFLVIAGEGPDRQSLLDFRRHVEISDRVLFVGVENHMDRLMRACDCFWSGSEAEDVPLAMLEAQTVGLPVIGSDIVSHRAVIRPELTGLLFPVGDCAQLVRQTERLLDDGGFAEALSSRAKRARRMEADAATTKGGPGSYAALYASLT